jgi:hypothetical protein
MKNQNWATKVGYFFWVSASSFRSEIEQEGTKIWILIAFKWQETIPSALNKWKLIKIDYPFVSNTKIELFIIVDLFNLPFSIENLKRKYFEDLQRHLFIAVGSSAMKFQWVEAPKDYYALVWLSFFCRILGFYWWMSPYSLVPFVADSTANNWIASFENIHIFNNITTFIII